MKIKPLRILLVDDESPQRSASKLRRLGGYNGDVDISTARSAEEAEIELRRARFSDEGSYDLVLSDYRMPGGNGSSLLQRMPFIDPCVDFAGLGGWDREQTDVPVFYAHEEAVGYINRKLERRKAFAAVA